MTTSGSRYSCQENKNVINASDRRPGLTIGTTTFVKVSKSVAPSIVAASRRSSGKSSMTVRIMKMENGRRSAAWGRITPTRVFRRPSSCRSPYSATITEGAGTTRPARNKPNRISLPGNFSFAKAKPASGAVSMTSRVEPVLIIRLLTKNCEKPLSNQTRRKLPISIGHGSVSGPGKQIGFAAQRGQHHQINGNQRIKRED